jgi:hypothetical protein
MIFNIEVNSAESIYMINKKIKIQKIPQIFIIILLKMSWIVVIKHKKNYFVKVLQKSMISLIQVGFNPAFYNIE